METILNVLERTVEEILGRTSGPLHFRVVIQPIVATILAIRAGLKDAREGQSAFLWTVLSNPDERRVLLRSGWKDISKIFIVACVLDAIYQLIELPAFHVIQLLIVAVGLAIVPYVLVRGPITRLMRALHYNDAARNSAKPQFNAYRTKH